MDGNPNAAATLGTFSVAVPNAPAGDTGPVATLGSAPTLTDASAGGETLTVTYASQYGISANTLSDSNLQVTGPNGLPQNTSFVSSTANADGSVTATYFVQGTYSYSGVGPDVPSGTTNSGSGGAIISTVVDASNSLTGPTLVESGASTSGVPTGVTNNLIPVDFGLSLANGTYTVSLVAGQVYDAKGASAAAATLGTFNVNLPANSNPNPTPTPIQPVFLDSSALSSIVAGKSTKVDPHHAALASLASTSASAQSTPARAHANVVHKKHHHHHKKKAVTASVQLSSQWHAPMAYPR
jgi:hypothetical protein